MGVGQGVVVAGGREGIESMKRLHAGDGAGDHGDGVGRHQRHVVGGPAQRQGVVGRAGGPQNVMGPQGLHVVVGVVLRVLHLQRHDLLLLAVGQVVRRSAPLGGQAVPPHLVALVALVVEGRERQDVEEKQRGSHGYRHAQFSGVVTSVSRKQLLGRTVRALGVGLGWEGWVGVPSGARARGSGPRPHSPWTSWGRAGGRGEDLV